MNTGLFVVLFLAIFGIAMIGAGLGFRVLEASRKKKVGTVLQRAMGARPVTEPAILSGSLAKPQLSERPIFRSLAQQIRQAGLAWSPLGMLAVMALLAGVGALLALFVRVPLIREFAMCGFTALFAALPFLYMRRKRSRRFADFEAQFPEALDFLARSLRAGHAFSVSLEMMSEESEDPLGAEFRQVFNEQNLGAPLETALADFSERMPLLDVRFFVASVLLQRETGGNLAGILTNLAYVIRERFRLKGQVRAASAHGRITALVLTALPVCTLLGLVVTSPKYFEPLVSDRDGRIMIVGAFLGQVLGYICMKRITNIKV